MIAVILLLCFMTVHSLEVSIPVSEESCFFIPGKKSDSGISLNYEIVHGEHDKLRTQVTSPSGKNLYYENGVDGRYHVEKLEEDGDYKLCFQNNVSPVGEVTVGFSFHANQNTQDVLSNADATKIKHAQRMEDLVYELNVNLDTVKDTQNYMRAKINDHHTTITSTNKRVMLWSSIEAVTLVCLAIWQISYLRRVFEVRRLI